MSAGRIWAIVIVALLHALIGYAFVTGLATKAIKQIKEDLKTFDVEEPPPPPEEEPPPPPPDTPTQPPPLTTPPPLNRMVNPNPMPAPPPPPNPQPFNPSPPSPLPAPPGPAPLPPTPPPVAPPAPTPPRVAARPATLRSGSITDDDYPAAAQRAEAEGTTVARYTIGPDGRATNCSVTSSSGNSALDATTCRLIQSRFRFRPAIGADGNPTSETRSQRVTWRLPAE